MSQINKTSSKHPPSKWERAKTAFECEAVIQENAAILAEWHKKHKPLVVMCSPEFFAVDAGNEGGDEVAGNGFVKAGLTAFQKNPEKNRQRILQEWVNLQKIIAACGADIIEMSPNPRFPDQVFTADHSFSCVYVKRQAGQLLEVQSKTIISQLAHPNRVQEVKEVTQFFDSLRGDQAFTNLLGSRDIILANDCFEGIGDNLLDPYRGIVLSGYGFRNSRQMLLHFQDLMQIPVYMFENKKPFFHIDTYCSILPGGYVLYAPDVMHPKTVAALEAVLFKGHQSLKDKYAIIAKREDAYAFACNAAILADQVVMQPGSQYLKEALANKGIAVTYTDAKVANFAGGGLHCMTNVINQPLAIID